MPCEWRWSDVNGNRKSICNQSASTWSIFMVTHFSWYLIQSRITVFAVPVCNAFDIVWICTVTIRFFMWIIQIYEICWKAIFINADTHTYICTDQPLAQFEHSDANGELQFTIQQSVAVTSLTNQTLLHNYRFLLSSAYSRHNFQYSIEFICKWTGFCGFFWVVLRCLHGNFQHSCVLPCDLVLVWFILLLKRCQNSEVLCHIAIVLQLL